jgi:hypothetical protein
MAERNKSEMLAHAGKLPGLLGEEIRQFIERNILIYAFSSSKKGNIFKSVPCCPRCLKAHTMQKARELGFDDETLNLLGLYFNCEEGHNGYYLDNDELKKCGTSLHKDA